MDINSIVEQAGQKLTQAVAGKKVLFVATKNRSYLRNLQEIDLLQAGAKQLTVIASNHKSYPIRLLVVYGRLLLHLLTHSDDVIFMGFAPQLLFPFLPLCRWKRLQIQMDFFISVYDTMVLDRKKFAVGSLPARLCHRLDRYVLRRADLAVVDTAAHKQFFCQEFGVPEDRFLVLYLKANQDIYRPLGREKPAHLKDKLVVLYFGSVLPLQGVDVVLQSMALLASNPDIHFIFVGPLGKHYAVDKAQYPHTEFYEWLPEEELAQQIDKADICLAGHFNGEIDKAKRTIAGKTYIYRAMGKPVVLGEGPANRELFSEEMPGVYFVPMGDAEALAQRLQGLQEQSARGL